MSESAGLSAMQLACSLFMHVALLLPLLAMPVTTAESGQWKFEDYVIYLVLNNPAPASGGTDSRDIDSVRHTRNSPLPAAAGELHASLPAVPAPAGKVRLEKSAGIDNPAPAATGRQNMTRKDGSAETLKEAAVEGSDPRPPEEERPAVLRAERPADGRKAEIAEALAPLTATPAAAIFFEEASSATLSAAESLPAAPATKEAPAGDHRQAAQQSMALSSPLKAAAAAADEIPVAERSSIIPLPDTPPAGSFFTAAERMMPAQALPDIVPGGTLKAGAAGDPKQGDERPLGDDVIQELIGRAASLSFPERETSSPAEASAGLPAIDLTHTAASPPAGRIASASVAETPPGEGAVPARLMRQTTASPPLPPLTAERERPAAVSPGAGPEKEGPGGRLPALPIVVHSLLKIEVSCAKDRLQDLSAQLLRKGYPAVVRRKEAATEVDLSTETLQSATKEKRILSVTDAVRGTYAFRVVNNGPTDDTVDILFLFSDGPKVTRVKQYKSVTIAAGGKAAYLFIIPDAIFWDDEDRFEGSIEDSDSITKFDDATGLVWREEKGY